MAPIITKEKIKEFLAAGNNIVIPNLSLVKDAAGAFSPLQWEEFSRYVTEMVGETALRWEVISHSGPEESLEQWKKNIDELRKCISLFHSLR